jgi:mitochondrial fission protein ELM1
MKHVLILSDGRKGHLNQSIAFVKIMQFTYTIVEVKFKNNFFKVLSYIFDALTIYTKKLFDKSSDNLIDNNTSMTYEMVIGTGSSTYYATKVLAKEMQVCSVVMMLPKGYRLDFDLIFTQKHDEAPVQNNIIEIPANFSYSQPQNIYKPSKKSIAIVIGGDNKIFKMSVANLKKQLDFIKAYYSEYEIAISTSPRTSDEVEKLIASYHFEYEVIFSKDPINPIPDFLEQCDTVFITADSTSMISEAVSYGKSNIVILLLEENNIEDKDNKFIHFISALQTQGHVHIFDGTIKNKNKKIDFLPYAKKARI